MPLSRQNTRLRDVEGDYIQCENCGRGATDWSVLVDQGDNVVAVECSTCGSSDWERAP